MSHFVTDRQVAKRLGVSRSTVWRWVKSTPQFPKPVELSAGCTRWKIEELEAWEQMRACRTASVAASRGEGTL